MDWIKTRLFQASTIRGLVFLAGSFGLINLTPSVQEALIAAIMGIIGLINVLTDEHKAAKATATVVAASVATDTARTAVEANLPWLIKQNQQQGARQ